MAKFWEDNKASAGSAVALLEAAYSKPRAFTRSDGLMNEEDIEEYETVATEIGVSSADIAIEKFRRFLYERDIPTFKISEVVAYMDAAAARDNPTKCGWHWCPVREKDCRFSMTFGTPSVEEAMTSHRVQRLPASDYYTSHPRESFPVPSSGGRVVWETRLSPSSLYAHTIPLHAMKKIALIERSYTEDIAFLISDYATAPHIRPDPFLMAVIPNSAVAAGKGRFIIDVWDEPGFGIERMIK